MLGTLQATQTTHVTRPEILKINWTTKPSGWVSGLTVRKEEKKTGRKPHKQQGLASLTSTQNSPSMPP